METFLSHKINIKIYFCPAFDRYRGGGGMMTFTTWVKNYFTECLHNTDITAWAWQNFYGNENLNIYRYV